MGPALVLGVVAGIFALLFVGRLGWLFAAERRVRDWARAENFTLERCERTFNLAGGLRPTWRIRVVDPNGVRREAWVRNGETLDGPLDVLWAAPGESVFR